jgi:hypothetical protein
MKAINITSDYGYEIFGVRKYWITDTTECLFYKIVEYPFWESKRNLRK